MDRMDGPTTPQVAQLVDILNDVARGFSNNEWGAGVRMYWVLDQPSIGFQIFNNQQIQDNWMDTNRNPWLRTEFIHAALVHQGLPDGVLGFAYSHGVMITCVHAVLYSNDHLIAVSNVIKTTLAHEITHTLIYPAPQPPFDAGNHLPDPNENGILYGVGFDEDDLTYLMCAGGAYPTRFALIKFSNPTIKAMDLRTKWSVEE